MVLKRDRIDSLDALRGCAALIVLLHHIAMLTVDTLPYGSVPRKLLVLLTFAGHPAVLIFFALSGFVLYINHGQRKERYAVYLTKRVFRIYPAFLVTFFLIAFATAFWPIEWQSEAPKLARIRNISMPPVHDWPRALTLIFTTSADTQINVVFWSLVYEMRFSLLFPLMAAALVRRPWLFVVGTAAVYLGATSWLISAGIEEPFIMTDRLDAAVMMTLHYLPVFALGMLAAHWFQRSRPPSLPFAVDAIAAGVIGLAMLFVRDDLAMAILGTAIILLCATGPGLRTVLAAKPFVFFGQISYSLYLVHLPVIAFALFWTQGAVAPVVSASLAGVASILVAWASYAWVERTGIVAGRVFLDRARNRRRAPQARLNWPG